MENPFKWRHYLFRPLLAFSRDVLDQNPDLNDVDGFKAWTFHRLYEKDAQMELEQIAGEVAEKILK